MINVEMFRRIEGIIITNPEQHSQASFENDYVGNACGTTRCVAGWAIHLWGQDNGINGTIWNIEKEYIKIHREASRYDHIGDAWYSNPEDVGGHILGLSDSEADELFFNLDNDDALRMVKEYARGNTNVKRMDVDEWM